MNSPDTRYATRSDVKSVIPIAVITPAANPAGTELARPVTFLFATMSPLPFRYKLFAAKEKRTGTDQICPGKDLHSITLRYPPEQPCAVPELQ